MNHTIAKLKDFAALRGQYLKSSLIGALISLILFVKIVLFFTKVLSHSLSQS